MSPQFQALEPRLLLSTAYTVDSLADVDALDGQITLREALYAANYNEPHYDAPAGSETEADVIEFDSALFASGPATITLNGAYLYIQGGGLNIIGPGADQLTIDAAGNSRVFYVTTNPDTGAPATVEISGLTITGGHAGMYPSSGGGIHVGNSANSLTLTDVVVTGNTTHTYGGGIYNTSATLVLIRTTVSDNIAGKQGGGLYVSDGGATTLTDVTVSGNTATERGGGIGSSYNSLLVEHSRIVDNTADLEDGGGIYSYVSVVAVHHSLVSGNVARRGGGIYQDQDALTVANSTITGNASRRDGGGIFIQDADDGVVLTNVTITDNRADSNGAGFYSGGGIYDNAGDGATTLHNTIVAGNYVGSDRVPNDVEGTFEAQSSYNVIGVIDGADGLDGTGTQHGTSHVPLEAMLAPLADNGGPTQTHALLPGSCAREAGSDDCANDGGLTTDQRGTGYDRFLGAVIDAGAFEADASGGSVGGTVWHDADENGSQDGGEGGIRGAQIRLYRDDGDGTYEPGSGDELAGMVTTDSSGRYTALALDEGSYWIDPVEASAALAGFVPTSGDDPMFVVLAADEDFTAGDYGFLYRPTVSTLADEDDGDRSYRDLSLREAIDLTNNNTGPDTIIFDPALFASGPATITLGGTELAITDDLTLTGPGADQLAIDGNGTSRVLAVGGPGTGPVTASVNGLKITGGNVDVAYSDGGGVYAYEGSLTITDSIISGNRVFGDNNSMGGGVSMATGVLNIVNTTISDNHTENGSGGGIYGYECTVTLTDVTITDNIAGGYGGAVYSGWGGGSLTITDSVVNRNTSNFSGAIANWGDLAVTRCTISGNSGGVGQGGGIYSITSRDAANTITITDSTITSNQANDGGGIYITDAFGPNDVTITNTTISLNEASNWGGGIYMWEVTVQAHWGL